MKIVCNDCRKWFDSKNKDQIKMIMGQKGPECYCKLCRSNLWKTYDKNKFKRVLSDFALGQRAIRSVNLKRMEVY